MKSVKSLDIAKFGPFSTLSLEFAPGINVLIGSNGTGKSQLLKVLYSVLKVHEEKLPIHGPAGAETKLAQKLIGVFRPADSGLGRIVQRNVGRSSAVVGMVGANGERCKFRVTTPGNLHVDTDTVSSTRSAVFLPSREALSMYEGFIQAHENRELSLDETYYDLCVALSGAALRGPRLAHAKGLVEPLEKVIGGRVVLSSGRFEVHSKEGNLEAHLLAEGWRKLAGIAHLILNGSLGENAFLLWDEPEANLNPRLTVMVRKMLVQLAASGVQVFIASHDYLLTHELNLAAERDDSGVAIRFFSLERNCDGDIEAEQANSLADITHNSILDEFAAHYDRENTLAGSPN